MIELLIVVAIIVLSPHRHPQPVGFTPCANEGRLSRQCALSSSSEATYQATAGAGIYAAWLIAHRRTH